MSKKKKEESREKKRSIHDLIQAETEH